MTRLQVESQFDRATSIFSHILWDESTRHAALIDSVLDYDLKSGRTRTASTDQLVQRVTELKLQVLWLLEPSVQQTSLGSKLSRAMLTWVVGFALVLGICQTALAQLPAEVAVGQALPVLTLKDQHDKPWVIPVSTRLVLFAAGRKASNLVQIVLQSMPKDPLTPRAAVYLVDVSKMPGFITRNFALPSLREMPYQIGVSLDEATLANWPRHPDAVTLIEVDQSRVRRIRYASTEAELRTELAP